MGCILVRRKGSSRSGLREKSYCGARLVRPAPFTRKPWSQRALGVAGIVRGNYCSLHISTCTPCDHYKLPMGLCYFLVSSAPGSSSSSPNHSAEFPMSSFRSFSPLLPIFGPLWDIFLQSFYSTHKHYILGSDSCLGSLYRAAPQTLMH